MIRPLRPVDSCAWPSGRGAPRPFPGQRVSCQGGSSSCFSSTASETPLLGTRSREPSFLLHGFCCHSTQRLDARCLILSRSLLAHVSLLMLASNALRLPVSSMLGACQFSAIHAARWWSLSASEPSECVAQCHTCTLGLDTIPFSRVGLPHPSARAQVLVPDERIDSRRLRVAWSRIAAPSCR